MKEEFSRFRFWISSTARMVFGTKVEKLQMRRRACSLMLREDDDDDEGTTPESETKEIATRYSAPLASPSALGFVT